MVAPTPLGHGLGVRFAKAPDPRTYAFPLTWTAPSPPPDTDFRPIMSPVQDQGAANSCTGFAGTACLEALLRTANDPLPDRPPPLKLSELYLYARDRQEDGTPLAQDPGASMLALCKALKEYGCCPETDDPYDPSGTSQAPTAQMDQDAGPYRIPAYFQVKGTGLALLQGVWATLAAGGPCLLAIDVFAPFTQTGADGKAPPIPPGAQSVGGHALPACIWFNDNSAWGGYGYVGAKNSWGEARGDAGYFYLPAGYFLNGIVREVWVLGWATLPLPMPVPPTPPTPQPIPGPTSTTVRELVADASARVKISRADPTAQWPAGTLEQADADLDA